MGVDIITVGFCPQYFSDWKVRSNSGKLYEVTLNGAEAMPHCTCPSFEFSKDGPWGKDCKHIKLIWDHGCLFNPQWKDAGPNDFAQYGVERSGYNVGQSWPEPCPGCGEQMIPVRIAV